MNKLKSSSATKSVEEIVFDFEKFATCMKKSISENLLGTVDVELENYLIAYDQLHNFFIILGTAFQFVATDVRSKIRILQSYQRDDRSNNFLTVKKMISYEINNKLLTEPKYVSGSRTLLRLHRGLDFLRKFLAEIYALEDDVKLGNIARNVYNDTLAEHHTWVVRNGARVAMQFLPTRIELLKKISDNDEEKLAVMIQLFPDAIAAMNIVFKRIQDLYTDNDLLNLP